MQTRASGSRQRQPTIGQADAVDLASLLISQEIYLRAIHTNLYAIKRLTYRPCASYSLHGAKVFLVAQALIANGAENLLERNKGEFSLQSAVVVNRHEKIYRKY